MHAVDLPAFPSWKQEKNCRSDLPPPTWCRLEMSDSIFGYWMRPSDTDESLSDYLWIGENGRMIHRINYKHGPFVMTLWYRHVKKDTYEVKLKPKSDWHGVTLQCGESELQMEHLDLLNPIAGLGRLAREVRGGEDGARLCPAALASPTAG